MQLTVPDFIPFDATGDCSNSSNTHFVVPCVFDVFSAFGKILFCFGGMAVFPSIQVDMKKPQDFSKAVAISLTSIGKYFENYKRL